MKEIAESIMILSVSFMCISLPLVMIWDYKFLDEKETERHERYTNEMKKAVSQAVYDIYLDMKENEDI